MLAHKRFKLSLPQQGSTAHNSTTIGSIYASTYPINAEAIDERAHRNEGVSKPSHALSLATTENAYPPPFAQYLHILTPSHHSNRHTAHDHVRQRMVVSHRPHSLPTDGTLRPRQFS